MLHLHFKHIAHSCTPTTVGSKLKQLCCTCFWLKPHSYGRCKFLPPETQSCTKTYLRAACLWGTFIVLCNKNVVRPLFFVLSSFSWRDLFFLPQKYHRPSWRIFISLSFFTQKTVTPVLDFFLWSKWIHAPLLPCVCYAPSKLAWMSLKKRQMFFHIHFLAILNMRWYDLYNFHSYFGFYVMVCVKTGAL